MINDMYWKAEASDLDAFLNLLIYNQKTTYFQKPGKKYQKPRPLMRKNIRNHPKNTPKCKDL